MTRQLADQLTSLVASGISLFAYRFADTQAGLGTNLNVIVLPSLGLDLDTLERLNLGQLQGIVGQDVTIDHARVSLPAGDAVRLSYTVPGSARTNGQAVAILQHLVLAGDQQLILTCTAPGGIAKIADECDGIAKTVEFLPLGRRRDALRRARCPPPGSPRRTPPAPRAVGDQRVGKRDEPVEPDLGKARRSGRPGPGPRRAVLVADVEREAQRRGVAALLLAARRRSAIRSAISSGSRKTKFSSSAKRIA